MNEENNHTKGEWEVWAGMRVANKTHQIADCFPEAQFRIPIEEAEANARLIAAAPELLEACETMLETLNGIAIGNEVEILEKAIAKAKGE